jgi:hypothetical protein
VKTKKAIREDGFSILKQSAFSSSLERKLAGLKYVNAAPAAFFVFIVRVTSGGKGPTAGHSRPTSAFFVFNALPYKLAPP